MKKKRRRCEAQKRIVRRRSVSARRTQPSPMRQRRFAGAAAGFQVAVWPSAVPIRRPSRRRPRDGSLKVRGVGVGWIASARGERLGGAWGRAGKLLRELAEPVRDGSPVDPLAPRVVLRLGRDVLFHRRERTGESSRICGSLAQRLIDLRHRSAREPDFATSARDFATGSEAEALRYFAISGFHSATGAPARIFWRSRWKSTAWRKGGGTSSRALSNSAGGRGLSPKTAGRAAAKAEEVKARTRKQTRRCTTKSAKRAPGPG